jgi:hypothetical protein
MQYYVSACRVQLTAKLADSKSFEAVKESHDNFLGKALSSRSLTSIRIRSKADIKFHNFDVRCDVGGKNKRFDSKF